MKTKETWLETGKVLRDRVQQLEDEIKAANAEKQEAIESKGRYRLLYIYTL